MQSRTDGATPPEIMRTERGLTISGTRVTLYDVVGYLNAQRTPGQTRAVLGLTDEQMRVALDYLAAHRDAVEAEYREVLRGAEEARRYWEERNRDRLEHIAALPPKPGSEALRARLAEHRAKRTEERSQPAQP